MTVLPLPPFAVVLIGLALFVVVIFTGLLLMGRDRPAPGWEAMTPGWLALTVVGALVWTGLFLMIVVAAFEGLRGAMETPEATSLGLGGLLVALLGAPFLIWTTWLKHRTVEFQKEGHMTDRISKAVEQLGAEKTVKFDVQYVSWRMPNDPLEHKDRVEKASKNPVPPDAVGTKWSKWETMEETRPNLEVRIGAILSLERIAQDSTRHDKGRDHVRVMEILCAYVRNNFPAPTSQRIDDATAQPTPRIDLQICLKVFKDRDKDQTHIEHSKKYRLNLRSCDFGGCDLMQTDYTGTDFTGSRFERTLLANSIFDGAQFENCLISNCTFVGSSLIGTSLNRSRVRRLGFGSFSTAERFAIFAEAADLTDISFTESNALNFFGSKDTEIHSRFRRAAEVGRIFGEESLWAQAGMERDEDFLNRQLSNYSDEERSEGKKFSHWNPFTYHDMASHNIRQRFRDLHGLNKWPHVD